MTGYALGQRMEEESEIQILDEDNDNIIRYSSAVLINLFSFLQKDSLTIPYSTIKSCKQARQNGAREVIYYATNRPDNYQKVRSVLELWGFSSYVEYLYTVCELGFLEGLIPVIDLGFLKPDELRNLSEIAALVRIKFDDYFDYKSGVPQDLDKKMLYRKKNLEWTGALNIPSRVGYMVTAKDESKKHNEWLEFIKSIHEKYNTVHELVLSPVYNKNEYAASPDVSRIKDAYLQAREMLPENVLVNIQVNPILSIKDYLDLGIRDLGTIITSSNNQVGIDAFDIDEAAFELNELGQLLHQRFPLSKAFIKAERYSKKLGQVFDAYRYKIKKETQEKLKESKV